MNEPRRFVLDANVFVSALLFKKSSPRQALNQARELGIILMSQSIWAEISEVLVRPKFDKYLTIKERQLFLFFFEQKVRFVDIQENISVCRDPKDNQYLELAISGKAACIVSGDKDLLTLHPYLVCLVKRKILLSQELWKLIVELNRCILESLEKRIEMKIG